MQTDRAETSLPARFVAGAVRALGRVHNVGQDGLFIGCGSIPEQGESVSLVFESPDGGQIRARGLVWWTTLQVRPHDSGRQGFGVRLLEVEPSYRVLVEQLLR